MNKTKIDWPFENLYTWNPIFGCLHGCTYCYARKMAIRFKGNFKPKFDEHIFEDPDIKKEKPRSIFIGSMADVFGEWVAFHDIQRIINKIREYPQHTYIFLTKNPVRYLDFDFKGINVWLGVTREGVAWTKQGDGVTMYTKRQEGCKTFLSAEPLLGTWGGATLKDAFDLIIVGALSGMRNAAPIPQEWIDSIVHPRIYYKKSLRYTAGGRVPMIENPPKPPFITPAAGKGEING